MTIKTLYRYTRADGGITTSTVEPLGEDYDTLSRLIADEGKMLTTDGENLTIFVDVENYEVANWYEVDAPEEEIPDVQDNQ